MSEREPNEPQRDYSATADALRGELRERFRDLDGWDPTEWLREFEAALRREMQEGSE